MKKEQKVILIVIIVLVILIGVAELSLFFTVKSIKNDISFLKTELGYTDDNQTDEEIEQEIESSPTEKSEEAILAFINYYNLTDNGSLFLFNENEINSLGLQLYSSKEEMAQDITQSNKKVTIDGKAYFLSKTSIPYSEYKETLLDYMSEDVFNEFFTKYQKNVDGKLYIVDINNEKENENFLFESMEKENENDDSYIVTYQYSDDGTNTSNKQVRMTFVENDDGITVVNSCEFI